MPDVTANTRVAYEIVAELTQKTQGNESFVIARECPSADAVRKSVRRLIGGRDWAKRVSIGVDGNMVFVRIKDIPREQQLEELLRKALGHIDNENLYDEIMEVLYGKAR